MSSCRPLEGLLATTQSCYTLRIVTESFTCPQCGKTHEGLPRDLAFKLPDIVWALAPEERAARARFNTDLCEFDGRFFIRGLLCMPFIGSDEYFGYGIWAQVDRAVFKRYVEIYDEDAELEPQAEGTIANRMPPYEQSNGENVSIAFGSASQRPRFTLAAESSSVLAREQREGIDEARYHDILDTNGML